MQRTTVEAWNIIRTTYVDPTFNHIDWDNELTVRLTSVANSRTAEEGERELRGLVSDLGDVYTRWMPSNKYQEFLTDSINSEVQGVGLLIASDPVSGRHLVLSPIVGGPAALAGIQKGDEIVRVNGAVLESTEEVGAALRGKLGTNVELEIARQVPGEVGSSGRPTEDARLERKKFRLKRQRVAMSPVFATAIHTDDDRTVGYIRALQSVLNSTLRPHALTLLLAPRASFVRSFATLQVQ
jgi:C-terminal processing protease CtpA/Prc